MSTLQYKPGGSFPVVGILGGGQLAKMLAAAARPLGIRVRILAPDRNQVIEGCFDDVTIADWADPEAVTAFAGTVDVLTVENEFVPVEALEAAREDGNRIFPSPETLTLIQDKFIQKETLRKHNLPTAPFRAVESPEEAAAFAEQHGWPLVLKRRHMGYDGKGNATVRAAADLEAAWDRLDGSIYPLYAEAFCPFVAEMAVMITRFPNGDTAAYPVVDTVQRNHICHTVTVPSAAPARCRETAAAFAVRAVEAIDAVGTVGVELFRMDDDSILINELAPRVHNTGHYTIEACACSQFENHIRAILGWPAGATSLRAPGAAMVNLLGDADGSGWPSGMDTAAALPAHVHLYGKATSRKGRKMGHVTALGTTPEAALETARRAADAIRFGLA